MTAINGDKLLEFLNSVPGLGDRDNQQLLINGFPESLISNVDWPGAKSSYLNKVVDMATQWGWLEEKGKHAFELILDNIEKFRLVEGLALKGDFIALKEYYQNITGSGLRTLNIAVIAMLRDEASEVQAGTLWNTLPTPPGECQLVDSLKGILKEHVDDLLSCYHESDRDKWSPLMGEGQSISEIVTETVERWKDSLEHTYSSPPITTHFHSNNFLSTNSGERNAVWNLFENEGGILIIDALSLCHPDVRQTFLNCQLISSNNPISLIVISPTSPTDKDINQLFERHLYASHLEKAFGYYADQLLPAYQFGAGNIYSLRRWLSNILSNIDRHVPSSEIRRAIRTERPTAPRGKIQKFIGTGISR